MCEQVGHPVLKLKRIKINGIDIGNLRSGELRYLTPDEVKKIKKEVMNDSGQRLR
jgi:16S rRNA U516 pseudouridylate synthase RsuA-like enzyme